MKIQKCYICMAIALLLTLGVDRALLEGAQQTRKWSDLWQETSENTTPKIQNTNSMWGDLFNHQPRDNRFPSGVSPSHVYGLVDRIDRTLDQILQSQGKSVPQNVWLIDQDFRPMHVYQLLTSCTQQLQHVVDELGRVRVPTYAMRPNQYAPRDVYILMLSLERHTLDIGLHFGLTNLPQRNYTFNDKTPGDVFKRLYNVYRKLLILGGTDDVSPNEVYSQMVRVTSDIRRMLRGLDPAARYRIDAKLSSENKKPEDVFKLCLTFRELIGRKRELIDQQKVKVPTYNGGHNVKPRHAFVQTQLIIAELNELKHLIGVQEVTPLGLIYQGKSPRDVFDHGTLGVYLLEQLKVK